jgi:outer membrane receptor for ferrienterochelin and colicin
MGPGGDDCRAHSATGTKTDTPIEKTPQSISVVTSEEMALHQPKSVKEALSYTPGVAVGRVAHPTPMTILSFVVLPQITRARITTSTV